ncbi:hypothetical protein SETIT_4G166800v2 [Setaria italica]|uniref:Uncharacterized protein n=1 Tax=Setaria italica TaxID=4555 RepID=A0A368QV63_SETIT|nr:hypothetical protein SETIT_4G166800v2 [Setaria italica]
MALHRHLGETALGQHIVERAGRGWGGRPSVGEAEQRVEAVDVGSWRWIDRMGSTLPAAKSQREGWVTAWKSSTTCLTSSVLRRRGWGAPSALAQRDRREQRWN